MRGLYSAIWPLTRPTGVDVLWKAAYTFPARISLCSQQCLSSFTSHELMDKKAVWKAGPFARLSRAWLCLVGLCLAWLQPESFLCNPRSWHLAGKSPNNKSVGG
jgi:hypothetical protein